MGDSEVEQLHDAPRPQHDVLRFHIAVENAEPVHVVQRVSHDAQHMYGVGEREGTTALQPLGHGLTLHVLHREQELTVGPALEVVDLSDARVAHCSD